jgi:hypothetical protein
LRTDLSRGGNPLVTEADFAYRDIASV